VEKIKKVAILEGVFIAILLILLASSIYEKNTKNNSVSEKSLLSPRITSGILKPQSLLIFNFKNLEEDIRSYMSINNLNSSLYVLNIRDGASFGIRENRRYGAASLNKLPVAIIIIKKVEMGELSLDTLLPITDEDRNPGSGTLYANPVKELTVRELLKYMLVESDNTAFSILAKQTSIEDGEKITEYLNYYQNNISYIESPKSLEITPKTTSNLFLSLYLSTILKPEDSEMMLRYLTNTSFNIKKYAKLPDDVIVAQKYGSFYYENKKDFYSCGIMYIDDSRIFYCIMTTDLEKEKAEQVVGEIVNKIYTYVIDNRDKSPYN